MVRLVYLGKLVDATGTPSETVDLPTHVQSTTDLRRWLVARFPDTESGFDASTRIALDSEICTEPAPIVDITEIAFLPPVGGG